MFLHSCHYFGEDKTIWKFKITDFQIKSILLIGLETKEPHIPITASFFVMGGEGGGASVNEEGIVFCGDKPSISGKSESNNRCKVKVRNAAHFSLLPAPTSSYIPSGIL